MSDINFSQLRRRADDATRPPEPGAGYVLEVVKTEVTKAQSTGMPMIKATLRVVEGPAAGKTVFNNFNLTLDNDFAISIFFRHMEAFGLDESFFARLPVGQPEAVLPPVAEALVGRRAVAELSVRTWQNVPRAQVDALSPYAGQGPVPGPGTHGVRPSSAATTPPSVSAPPSVTAPTISSAPTVGATLEGPPPLPF